MADYINKIRTTEGDKPVNYEALANKPNSLPNPNKIKFTGSVVAEYDGSSEVTVNIPNGASEEQVAQIQTNTNDISELKNKTSELKDDLNDYCVDSDFTLLKQNYLTSAYNGFYVNKNGDFGFNNVDNITSEMFVTAFLPPLKELCFTITSGENWFILGGKNKNYVCKEITGHNQNLAEFVNSSNEFNVLGQLTDYPVLEAGTTIKIAVENGIYKFFKLENGVYTEYYSLNKAEYNSSVWTNDRFGFIASVYASGQFDGTPIFKNVNAKFPKADVLANSIIEQNKPYYSKKYHAIGDSITQGINATNAQYFTHFNDLCGFSVITTDGIGGSCLSSGDENSGVSRLVNIPSDSDIVSIFMGTNDFGHHHMLGNMHDSTPSDTSTFYGALKYTCEYMNTNFNNKWFFITPIQRNYKYAPALNMNSGVETNRNGNTLEEYANAIIQVCEYYCVPYIDLYHNCFDGHSEKVKELYLTDGLHPNQNGHIIMARKISKFINDQLNTTLSAAQGVALKALIDAIPKTSTGIERIEKLSTDTAVELEPNKLYIFPEMSELTLTFAEPSDTSIANEYHVVFQSGSTPTSLVIPNAIKLPSEFAMEANKVYRLSILEGCLIAHSWTRGFTFHVKIDSSLDYPYLFSWETDKNESVTIWGDNWPGEPMKENENGWFTRELPPRQHNGHLHCIITCEAGNNQTLNIDIDGSKSDVWITVNASYEYMVHYEKPTI